MMDDWLGSIFSAVTLQYIFGYKDYNWVLV